MDAAPEMAWAKFTKDHDHRLHPAGTIGFKAGMRAQLVRGGFAIAQALGRAVEIPAPNRATAEALKANPWAADIADPPPPPAPPAGAPPAPLAPQTPPRSAQPANAAPGAPRAAQ